MQLQDSITVLKGVGPAMEKRLGLLGIHTVKDMLYHMPRQYDDRSQATPIDTVQEGDSVTIVATIEHMKARQTFGKRRLHIIDATVSDNTESMRVVWFNQPYLTNTLHIGDTVALTGKVKASKYGLQLQSPSYEKRGAQARGTHSGRIVPEYPLTAGLTQKQFRFFVKQILDSRIPVEDTLPEAIIDKYQLTHLEVALYQVHFPDSEEERREAEKRLFMERLLLPQLYAQVQRTLIEKQNASPLPFKEEAIKQFVEQLPFTLTNAQKKSAWAILQDMEKSVPMHRLLIGDVGSGKTVVAAMAVLNTVLNKKQAVIMAPTEILAEQHATTVRTLLADFDIQIALHTASHKYEGLKKKKSGNTTTAAFTGMQPQVFIGTHALIQEHISFENLGLVVIDEQHRFGVKQRKALKETSGDPDTMPHLLSMSATPIPRSLALSLYGDLDLSIIDELPAGRKTTETTVIPSTERKKMYDHISERVAEGEQAFVICPLVEMSEKVDGRNVTDEYEELQSIFPDYTVGLIHGKLKAEEKQHIMEKMKNKEIDILVATSVIEVGVDIPDATIIVIENAERFGLAQLHQFRGRVGRSDKQAYCYLCTDSKSDAAQKRLGAMEDSNDGMYLAQVDLEMRGAGEVFGVSQSGFSDAAIVALQQPQLVERIQNIAQDIIEHQYHNTYLPLVQKLQQFTESIHLE